MDATGSGKLRRMGLACQGPSFDFNTGLGILMGLACLCLSGKYGGNRARVSCVGWGWSDKAQALTSTPGLAF